MNIARVIVDLSLDRPFDYRIPEELRSSIRIGTRVIVPFARSRRSGFVLDLTDQMRLVLPVTVACASAASPAARWAMPPPRN